MGSNLIRVLGLTLAMGGTVVMSWVAVRGLSVFSGHGPFLDPTWTVIWAVQAGLASLLGLVIGRWWERDVSGPALVGTVMAAWVGELVVATALAPFVAGELSVVHGPYLWVVATGGPLQPFAVIVGAGIGRWTARRTESAPAPAG